MSNINEGTTDIPVASPVQQDDYIPYDREGLAQAWDILHGLRESLSRDETWFSGPTAPLIEAIAAALRSPADATRIAELEAERGKHFDIVQHLARQIAWSRQTFGPGSRTKGVIDHIRKELTEIEADPADLKEWVDVIILAFDGAWRAGWEPQAIADAIVAKQTKNEARVWPDWRTMSEDVAIEHDRARPAP